VRWTFSIQNHSITFRGAAPGGARPVFDGCTAAGACAGRTWFTLASSSGASTNLVFQGLRVTRYTTAISLEGNRDSVNRFNSGNRITACLFDRIGNGFAPTLPSSTAAIRLVNSDRNVIEGNTFTDVINVGRNAALIHAMYVAHGSSGNTIRNNTIERSTGDPIRLRDYSNNNTIEHNTLSRVGTAAGYTDWYCDHDTRTDCTKATPECPSWNNAFRDNVLDGKWSCAALANFVYFQDAAATGCSPPSAGAPRLRTSGNRASARPCSL
jgi:parallel beta-helix repeat protein